MENREVIVNLWYVSDENRIIYSLRVKAYVGTGSDAEKLDFLQRRARLDYLIACPFEIPKRFHAHVGGGADSQVMAVSHVEMLDILDSPLALFEDALKVVESRFPAQSDLSIPQDPLTCTTRLRQNKDGVIEPQIGGQEPY